MTAWQTFGQRALYALGALCVVIASLALGHLLPTHQTVVVAVVIALLIFTVGLTDPALMMLICLPLFFVVARTGAGDTSLTVSDLALGLCVAPAIIGGTRPLSPPLRSLLWLSAIYQASTALTLVANPYRANYVEWFHEWLLISGALLVGWVLGRHGRAAVATWLILACGVVIAAGVYAAAIRQYASGDFAAINATFPFEMNKNFSGSVLSLVAAVSYARERWMRLPRGVGLTVFWICVGGIGLAQSRQAAIGLVVAIAWLVLRGDRQARRSQLLLLGVVPVIGFITTLVTNQLSGGNQFSSSNQRLTWYDQSISVWQHDVWFGVGLRWWYTDRFPSGFQPPQAELEVLTSAGIIGLLGFLIWALGSLKKLAGIDQRYGALAFALLANRVIAGQFDIFWVAVTTSLPFVGIGICLGAQAYDEATARAREAADAPSADTLQRALAR
ncbi:O-antigen ligase family protein [Flexivirga meconopsidis]|uniref:O-antigen ligase family protein n=1 Tax=Flexivirga meconopsidis TaxID=2977121 RepID=UPI00224029E7|nr:O-antigen ligase family protein [Flexivirga meconopsidis]